MLLTCNETDEVVFIKNQIKSSFPWLGDQDINVEGAKSNNKGTWYKTKNGNCDLYTDGYTEENYKFKIAKNFSYVLCIYRNSDGVISNLSVVIDNTDTKPISRFKEFIDPNTLAFLV